MPAITELKSNYCARQQSEGSYRSTSIYSSVSKLINWFLLSFGLLFMVWIKTESWCQAATTELLCVSVLECQKRERGSVRERENEWVVKVRVSWGKKERNCFHYKETEWRFYGCEISQAAFYSAGKYRLQRVGALRREDRGAIKGDCHGRAREERKVTFSHLFSGIIFDAFGAWNSGKNLMLFEGMNEKNAAWLAILA